MWREGRAERRIAPREQFAANRATRCRPGLRDDQQVARPRHSNVCEAPALREAISLFALRDPGIRRLLPFELVEADRPSPPIGFHLPGCSRNPLLPRASA